MDNRARLNLVPQKRLDSDDSSLGLGLTAQVAFDMVNHAAVWDVDVAAASNLIIGGSCLAVTAALAYALRRLRGLRHRAAFVPVAIFIAFTGAAHFVDAFGVFQIDRRVQGFLLALAVASAIGSVVLLREVLLRAAALTAGEEISRRRETELTATVEQLSSAYSRSLELAELKTQVFANVSHELRTPLTLILGPVQKLREASNLIEEQRTVLTMVERNAHLLLGHVSDLLELSRVDSIGVELNRRSTEVGLVIRTLASSFRDLAKHLGVEYEVDLPRMGKSVLLDGEKLERIAMNLLANAFKFTPRGGRVVFRVRLAPDSERVGQLELTLTVDDSGPGIRVEDRARVFERFRQLDGKPNRAFGGTGLGLAIVKEFVQAYAGTVAIEDSPEGGARFVVRLPVELSEQVDSDREALPSASSAEMLALSPRPSVERGFDPGADLPLILVVEDNPDMNRFVCSSLSGEFQVASAVDGPQALARLELLTPDLIVTDFMMPRMSGDEFVQALREKPALRDIPVLVLTARDDTELRVRVLEGGVQDWLTKPFTVPELIVRARNLISARQARAVLREELTTREFDLGELARQLAERKRQLESLLETLTQALEQAELASRFKTSLLRLVSHELRTPLGALQLQLERLAGTQHGTLSDPQRQLIVRMRRSLSRLTDTIQSLLEYARIESGRLELCSEVFDLRDLAQSVIDDFSPQAEGKGLRIALIAAAGPTLFESDARLLRLVLVNLISNALKFTEHGEVVLGLQILVDHCELEVKDTGPGIPAELRTSVFEPFFQGESAARRHAAGTGLGLSLVREMLNALGGSIELLSEVGVGSTFRISVPVAGVLRNALQHAAEIA
ncbi:MAG TPA: ATP-binding protein [Polyangiaceae bacterium]|nr:ATP-binding protein [Polyangiaceae bacterium]